MRWVLEMSSLAGPLISWPLALLAPQLCTGAPHSLVASCQSASGSMFQADSLASEAVRLAPARGPHSYARGQFDRRSLAGAGSIVARWRSPRGAHWRVSRKIITIRPRVLLDLVSFALSSAVSSSWPQSPLGGGGGGGAARLSPWAASSGASCSHNWACNSRLATRNPLTACRRQMATLEASRDAGQLCAHRAQKTPPWARLQPHCCSLFSLKFARLERDKLLFCEARRG